MQFAVAIIKSCRENGTDTPFLSKVLNGHDGFLGRPLTDSELAEECMGGMYVGSILMMNISHKLTEIGLVEAEQPRQHSSIFSGLFYNGPMLSRSCRMSWTRPFLRVATLLIPW